MWICNNCRSLDVSPEKPLRCSVCGAPADKIVPHEVPQVKGAKTLKNLKDAFVAESKAHSRNRAFAFKAELENYPQIAKLFHAIAESEGIHAFNELTFMGGVAETQANLQTAFEKENVATGAYPQFVREANEEGNTEIALTFGLHRDVERIHAKLYEKALEHMLADKSTDYYVCGVCGYVSDSELPDPCPICGAPKERFKKITY
jgi:rubrerythrin